MITPQAPPRAPSRTAQPQIGSAGQNCRGADRPADRPQVPQVIRTLEAVEVRTLFVVFPDTYISVRRSTSQNRTLMCGALLRADSCRCASYCNLKNAKVRRRYAPAILRRLRCGPADGTHQAMRYNLRAPSGPATGTTARGSTAIVTRRMFHGNVSRQRRPRQ
jgi:hypothetical protein